MANEFRSDIPQSSSSTSVGATPFNSAYATVLELLASAGATGADTSSAMASNTRCNLIDNEINQLYKRIESLENEKATLKQFISGTNVINKRLLVLICLIPSVFMLTFYFALRDYIATLPVYVSQIFFAMLSLLLVADAVKILVYIPKELEYMKRDIEKLQESIK